MSQVHSDRFIPMRQHSAPHHGKSAVQIRIPKDHTISTTFNTTGNKKKQLIFKKTQTHEPNVSEFRTTLQTLTSPSTSSKIEKVQPQLVGQNEEVVDNFYYNCLDVSNQDVFGLGLGKKLYIQDLEKRGIHEFYDRFGKDFISCVKFFAKDQVILAGQQKGSIEVNDAIQLKTIRYLRKHKFRVGKIETDTYSSNVFYSGSRDYAINVIDIRKSEPLVARLQSHKSEVCGLSLKGNYLASSSNEGCVKIWDIRTQQVLQKHHVHRSAVKALEWCPWKPSHLISGGGIHDRKICVYDATKFEIQHIIKHNYQITGLAFNNSTKQVMFSYGNLYRQRTNNHLPNQRHNVGNVLWSQNEVETAASSQNENDPETIRMSEIFRDLLFDEENSVLESEYEGKSSIGILKYFGKNQKIRKFEKIEGKILVLKGSKKNDNIVYTLSTDGCLRSWDMSDTQKKMKPDEMMGKTFGFH